MHLDGKSYDFDQAKLSVVDRFIIDRFNETLKEVQTNMDRYEYANVGHALTKFIWDDFANWYIELSKTGLQSDDEMVVYSTKATLEKMLKNIVILLSPFMPFVSEEIYLALPDRLESINLESYPKAIDVNTDDLHQIHYVLDAITAVRESRVTYEVKPSKLLSIQLLDSNNASYNLSKTIKDMFEQMSKTEIVDSISEQLNIPIHNGSMF